MTSGQTFPLGHSSLSHCISWLRQTPAAMKGTATDIPSTEIQTIKLSDKGSWALPGVRTLWHTSCVSPAGATHNKSNTSKYYSLANLSLTFAPVTLLLGLFLLSDTSSTSSAQLTYLLTKTPWHCLQIAQCCR